MPEPTNDNARIVRDGLETYVPATDHELFPALVALSDLETELATLKADLERAREEAKRKDWAIAKALGWFHDPDENPLTQFERIGDWFYDETGHLRPGKDDRTEDTSSPENRDRFVKWCQNKSRERLADLRAALAPEQKDQPNKENS